MEITVLGEGNLSASLTVNIAVPECPGDIAGTYLATTDASTPFDGPYDNTGSPCRLTIVDNGDGSYTFSDLTAGLYGDYYAGIVGAREDCEDISGLEGNVTRTGCSLAGTVPDHPGFICRFGENDMRVSAVIDVDGVITLSFENPAGDKGTATLVKQ